MPDEKAPAAKIRIDEHTVMVIHDTIQSGDDIYAGDYVYRVASWDEVDTLLKGELPKGKEPKLQQHAQDARDLAELRARRAAEEAEKELEAKRKEEAALYEKLKAEARKELEAEKKEKKG